MREIEPFETKPPEAELATGLNLGTDEIRRAQEEATQQMDAPPYDMMQNILLKQDLKNLDTPATGHNEPDNPDVINGPH